ncbi:hypothetical protein MUTS16_40410 [Escherichia coli]|nr:hypothetical protein MUTS16_40410 [Escherichia coli]
MKAPTNNDRINKIPVSAYAIPFPISFLWYVQLNKGLKIPIAKLSK